MAYQPLEYVNKKEDLSQILVGSDLKTWSFSFDLDLPEDATRIFALQPLLVPFGDDVLAGLAVVYELQGMKPHTKIFFFSSSSLSAEFTFKLSADKIRRSSPYRSSTIDFHVHRPADQVSSFIGVSRK